MSRKQEIGIVNTICMNTTNTAPQVVLMRLRGEQIDPQTGERAKTVKVSPHLFKDGLPLPGEAVYLDFDPRDMKDAGPNYRILRNAKVSLEAPVDHTSTAAVTNHAPLTASVGELSAAHAASHTEATHAAATADPKVATGADSFTEAADSGLNVAETDVPF